MATASAKRVLIVTGEDYPGHKWQETTPVLRQLLAQDTRLQLAVLDDLRKLAAAPLSDYDVLVLHFKNYDPAVPGPAAQERIGQFVEQGGGLVLVHFAGGAFQEWPGFVQLAGRVWNPKLRGHDPRGPFTVEIVAPEHPIARGLANFETKDELYTCLVGETPITVVAEATSKVDQRRYPMAFVLQPGKGRVFHCPLGHDVAAFAAPEVGELFRRGCAWSAGLAPVNPAAEHAGKDALVQPSK